MQACQICALEGFAMKALGGVECQTVVIVCDVGVDGFLGRAGFGVDGRHIITLLVERHDGVDFAFFDCWIGQVAIGARDEVGHGGVLSAPLEGQAHARCLCDGAR